MKHAVDVTADLAASSTKLDLVKGAEQSGGYNFYPTGIIINPSADDAVELKTVVCESMNGKQLTLILECGKVHDVSLSKIIKSGTTTQTITIIGETA